MARFTPVGENIGSDMFAFFAFAPPHGAAIGSIAGDGTSLTVAGTVGDDTLVYEGSDLAASGSDPGGGTFHAITLVDGSAGPVARITDIDPALGRFGEIDTSAAWDILLGDDEITGTRGPDRLFTGGGGNDTVSAGPGWDSIWIPVRSTIGIAIFIDGGPGIDTLRVIRNLSEIATTLDLRGSVIESIEAMMVEDGLTLTIDADQIATGKIAPSATVGTASGAAELHVVLSAAGTLDASGLQIGPKIKVVLEGSAGSDTILGTAAPDTIRGGRGADAMTGGAGTDVFDFDFVRESGNRKAKGLDTIRDFEKGDHIDLSGIDANAEKPGEQAFKFVAKEGTAFKSAAGTITWEQVDRAGTAKDRTTIYADVDGDKTPDMAIKLKGLVDLAKGDFVL